MLLSVDVVAQARARIEAGDLSAAHELLDEMLTTVPTEPAEATAEEIEAAALQTGVLLGLGEPFAARGWAAWGHAAHRHHYGERDRRTLHTLGLLAAVLARVGAHVRAAARYHHLISVYSELDGAGSDRVLAARADLATVEHARGHCVGARFHLAGVVAEHQQLYGHSHPVGIRMQARLAAMWRDCGDFDHAHALLAEARDWASVFPDADPIHRLLVAAARAGADQRHVCGQAPAPLQPSTALGQLAAPPAPDARPAAQAEPRPLVQPDPAPAPVSPAPVSPAPVSPAPVSPAPVNDAAGSPATAQWGSPPVPPMPVYLPANMPPVADEPLAATLADAQAGTTDPSAARPLLNAQLFTAMHYLPPPPDLVPAHLASRRPATVVVPQRPRQTLSTWVLAASCVGIVLVTLLFLLVLSTMRQA